MLKLPPTISARPRSQSVQYFEHVVREFWIVQVRYKIGDGPAHVARNEFDHLRRLRREPGHVEIVVQEERRDVRAVEQVFMLLPSKAGIAPVRAGAGPRAEWTCPCSVG